ncbi:hypothetical protein IE4872_PA00002 (plasmid) [Rhizobium gallicum]|uniref:Uncharacterized protein n=1 Tax=Rhizobium gallicum TaxID=56730 RepID=A0A1L5NPD4_9HYPH|nr:hypothetical protein IE4872_PA00002 [Rhizobium gallicum]
MTLVGHPLLEPGSDAARNRAPVRLRNRTPRGGSKWSLSAVKNLFGHAVRTRLLAGASNTEIPIGE